MWYNHYATWLPIFRMRAVRRGFRQPLRAVFMFDNIARQ
nr:MAG TPA: hypothetical protein [Caudoviricetes sp.]